MKHELCLQYCILFIIGIENINFDDELLTRKYKFLLAFCMFSPKVISHIYVWNMPAYIYIIMNINVPPD